MQEYLDYQQRHYVNPIHKGFVLPTKQIVRNLFSELAKMNNTDFDINELVTISLSCIEIKKDAELKIVEAVQTTKRFFHIPLAIRLQERDQQIRQNAIRDCEILTTAWFTFTMGLFAICQQVNIWDEDGVSRLYLKRFLNDDIVLCRFPD